MLEISEMRRTMPRVVSTEIKPRPVACRSSSAMLVTTPAYRTTSGAASLPLRMLRSVTGTARSGMPVCSSAAAMTSTTGAAASDAARTASLVRSDCNAAATMRSCGGACASRLSGDSASGSGIRTSRPMAAGPAWLTMSTRRASRVRGQGHWPSASRLLWSIATTVTGSVPTCRGAIAWWASNQADCRRSAHGAFSQVSRASATSRTTAMRRMRTTLVAGEAGFTARFPARRRPR